MGFNFRGGDRDQQFLMPPSVRDWLPGSHLAWFVIDVVEELDLSAFTDRYRVDGRGGAAYDPSVLVAVLVYAYCVGDRSSRLIERRLVEDVAYRVVAANACPDHATVARFRGDHEDAIGELFAQVLVLCAGAGMVQVGVVAVDGTKIAADASGAKNMTEGQLEQACADEGRRIVEEAKAIDAAEDERFGDARGDELPAELAERSQRLARLRVAKRRLESQRSNGSSSGNRPPKINVTDPDSRVMKTSTGFVQGFNAQAAATAEQIIVAAELTSSPVDMHQLEPVITAVRANLAAAGIHDPIGTILADAGYYSTDNASLDTGCGLLIAPTKTRSLPHEPLPAPRDRWAEDDHLEQQRAAHRSDVFDRTLRGEITLTAAAAELHMSVSRACVLRQAYQQRGVEALIRRKRPNGKGRRPRRNDRSTLIRHEMLERLASVEGRWLYAKRATTIEPVFGQIKAARNARRFQRRGLAACASEWKLLAATHNLLKLWRRHPSTA
jgi:transposase